MIWFRLDPAELSSCLTLVFRLQVYGLNFLGLTGALPSPGWDYSSLTSS